MIVVPAALGQLADGDQRGDRRRRDRLAALVDDEAAVGVAVEGQPDVGAVLADRACRSTRLAGSSGLASWLGKVPSSSKYSGARAAAAGRRARRHGVPAHAVAGVDDDLQRPDAGQVDQRAQVAAYSASRSRSLTVPPARRSGVGRRGALGAPRGSRQPGVLPDRGGAGPAQLDAVVLRRVVAGGEHRARAGPSEPEAKYSRSVEGASLTVERCGDRG
jgi:hypothetical protein